MVLGFALCATVAFAQTNNFRTVGNQTKAAAINAPVDAPAVDYKASIFTKAAGDTIVCYQFTAADAANMTYGQDGWIKTNNHTIKYYDAEHGTWADSIWNHHSQTRMGSCWDRIADSAALYSSDAADLMGSSSWMLYNQYRNDIPYFMSTRFTGNNNGYMLMTMRATMGTGLHDAFFTLPSVARPAGATVINVRLTQLYRKFYDECYIDCKINGAWYAREINIEGVDMDVNDFGSIRAGWTMPLELAQENNIELRVRWYNRRARSNAYGYAWAIDNFAITEGAASHWYTQGENFIDGGYGQIPAGFNLPMSWYGSIWNNGSVDQENATVTMYHLDATRSNPTPFLSAPMETIEGDPLREQYAVVNERGFMPIMDSLGYAGWLGMGTDYPNNYGANSNISANYLRRGLPTDETGLHYMTTTATDAVSGINAAEWDTIAYFVTDTAFGGDANHAVRGARWAHDNGIIASMSRYSYGYVVIDGNTYITDSGNYGSTNYMVWLRYVTPDVIPTENGEPWVFRGLEIVPQTMDAANQIVSSKIFPIAYEQTYTVTGDTTSFETLNTGVSDVTPHTVVAGEINTLTSGYLTNEDPYKAVNIKYYNQPALKPNTAYYFGYQIAEPCFFAAAATNDQFYNGSSYSSYQNTAALKNFAPQFKPAGYDTRVYDPANGYLWSFFYHPYYPMIRPIVGPKETLPTHIVSANCTDTNYIIMRFEGENQVNMCGDEYAAVEGSDPSFYVIPNIDSAILGSHPGVIDYITIDGTRVNLQNPPAGVQVSERPYNLENADGDVLLRRNYYIVTFSGINAPHTISASAHSYQHGLGIEAEASHVSLGLRPNPATSQVSLNVQGVSGSLNCSIIDMSGRVVYNANINAEEAHTIDLSGVAAGAYFVRVTNDSFSKVEKLIVR